MRIMLAAMLGLGVTVLSAPVYAQEGSIVTEVSGHWISASFNIESLDEETGAFVVSGGDIFEGAFSGTSSFVATGTLYPDGSASGFSDEIITGVAEDGTSGTITESHQPFTLSPEGLFDEESPITDGTGDWVGSTGLLHYTGWLFPFGDTPWQGGEYHGVWIRPRE